MSKTTLGKDTTNWRVDIGGVEYPFHEIGLEAAAALVLFVPRTREEHATWVSAALTNSLSKKDYQDLVKRMRVHEIDVYDLVAAVYHIAYVNGADSPADYPQVSPRERAAWLRAAGQE